MMTSGCNVAGVDKIRKKSRYLNTGTFDDVLEHLFPSKLAMYLLLAISMLAVPRVSFFSIWYYAAFAGIFLIWIRFLGKIHKYILDITSIKSIVECIYRAITPIALVHYYNSFLRSFGALFVMPFKERRIEYIEKSAFGTTIRTSLFVHIYLIYVCIADAYFPGHAQNLYQFFNDLPYIYSRISDHDDRMIAWLVAEGYGGRVDFLMHAYSAAIFWSFIGLIFSILDIRKVFSTEQRYAIKLFATTNVFNLKSRPNIGLFQLVFIPPFSIFAIMFLTDATFPLSLDYPFNMWHIFANKAHVARMDVLYLGVAMPLAFIFLPWIAIRSVTANIYLFARGVRRGGKKVIHFVIKRQRNI